MSGAGYPAGGRGRSEPVQATTWRIWCTITITAEASSTGEPAVLPISVASRW